MLRVDAEIQDNRGFFQALLGDGRPLLSFVGLCLILSGGFALMQSASGHFLPHDVQYLGMTAQELCGFNQCKVVHFMFHDRVSFGGAIIGIGIMYLWLAEFPLKQRRAWAWWVFAISGAAGFASFLSYLSYGYFDSWHGMATLLLFPCFLIGMILSWRKLERPRSIKSLLKSGVPIALRTRFDIGRNLLLVVSFGLICAGLTILTVGATIVFVPTDLTFMGLDRAKLQSINARLSRSSPTTAPASAEESAPAASHCSSASGAAQCREVSGKLWPSPDSPASAPPSQFIP